MTLFSDKELDELDLRFKRALEDKSDAYAEQINALQARIAELEAALQEIVATKHYTQPMQYAHKIAKLALGEKE